MRQTARRTVLALALSLAASGAVAPVFAQGSNLRIGLADDPDVLDPTLSRSYTARIVFASTCDKLFDIDEKLNIVP
jgi:peptide/nickel transport system substrate-binding protein